MMRKFGFLVVLIVFVFVFVGAGAIVARAADPIKIGFMAPYVGSGAKFGTDLRDGFKLALDEVGYKVAGREIQFLNEESEGKPEIGLAKARKLVEKERDPDPFRGTHEPRRLRD